MFEGSQEVPRFLIETVEKTPYGEDHKVIDIFSNVIQALDGTEFKWTDEDLGDTNFSISRSASKFVPLPRGKLTRKIVPTQEQIERGKANFLESYQVAVQNRSEWSDVDQVMESDQGVELMQRQILEVALQRGKFSIKDLPQLLIQLQSNHNSLAQENAKILSERDKGVWDNGYLLEVTKRIGSEYCFWSDRLEDAMVSVGIDNPEALGEIKMYIDQLRSLAKTFGIDGTKYSESEVSSWTKDVSIYQHGDPSSETENIARHLKYLKSKNFYGAKIGSFKNKVRQLVSEKVNQSLEDTLMEFVIERGQTEIMRLSDAGNIFKQVIAGTIDPLSDFLGQEGKEKDNFGVLKERFKNLKARMEQVNLEEKGGVEAELANLEIEIAREINAVIYHPQYWLYKGGAIDTHQIILKFANCVARGNLQHIIWKQIFGEETIGATTDDHFFSILKLADGRLLNLDSLVTGEPNILSDIIVKDGIQDTKSVSKGWIIVGNHSKMISAGTFDWIGKRNDSEFAHRQAIRLLPDNPGFHNNLGVTLQGLKKFLQAEAEFKEALRLAPNYVGIHANLGDLYTNMGSDYYPQAEAELQKALESANKDDPQIAYYTTNLAKYYFQLANQPQKAKPLYEEALRLMDQGKKNIFEREEIMDALQSIK